MSNVPPCGIQGSQGTASSQKRAMLLVGDEVDSSRGQPNVLDIEFVCFARLGFGVAKQGVTFEARHNVGIPGCCRYIVALCLRCWQELCPSVMGGVMRDAIAFM